jgi:hypothetical protein
MQPKKKEFKGFSNFFTGLMKKREKEEEKPKEVGDLISDILEVS